MAKTKTLSTYEIVVKGIRDFENSERNSDDYLAMMIATSKAFSQDIGLGWHEISMAIDEALNVIKKGQCWQIEDDEDHCLWVDGVDGNTIYMMNNSHQIFKWDRESLLECGKQVEDD